MTDYSELKRLAEACRGVSGSELIGARVQFHHAAKPSAVLALLAEVEALRSQVAALQSDANSWQSGYDEGRRIGTNTALDEREELRKDADRYRWLRAQGGKVWRDAVPGIPSKGIMYDIAVDAVMSKGEGR